MQLNKALIQIIGNDAVRLAQRKSLENGMIYFQLPDGTITMDNSFEKGELKKRLDELIKDDSKIKR